MHKIVNILLIATVAAFASGCDQPSTMTEPRNDESVEVPVSLQIGVNQNLYQGSTLTPGYISDDNPAPRRLVTWDGQQSINDLRVYVFEGDSYNGEFYYIGGGDCSDGGYQVYEFNNDVPWIRNPYDPTQGNFESHIYNFKPRLQKYRYYKFLAVGRDDKNGEQIPNGYVTYIPWGTKTISEADFEVGVTEIHEAGLRNLLNANSIPYYTTEIFSGIMTFMDIDGKIKEDYIHIDDEFTGFEKHITLTRAVAGLWVYVTDIPTVVYDNSNDADKNGIDFYPDDLTIYQSIASSSINLYSHQNNGTPLNFDPIVGYVDFRNNFGIKDDKIWYKSDDDDYWQREEIKNFRGVTIAANSALITNYLMPIDISDLLDDGTTTLTMKFRANVAHLEFTLSLKCRIGSITNQVTGETYNYDSDTYRFPIIPNCIYAIGSPDAPYSLSKLCKSKSRGVEEIELTCIPL